MFFKRYKNLRQMKPYFKKYMPLTISLLIVAVIASSLGMVIAYFMSEQLVGITNQNINQMVKFTILIMAAVLIHHICWFLWSRFGAVLSNYVANDIRRNLISKTLGTKFQTIKENPSGYYIERLNDDTNEVSSFLTNVASTMVDVLTNCSFLLLIYFLNWQCGLFFTVGASLLFVVDAIKVKKDLKHLQGVKKTTEQSNSKFNELIRGIKDVKGLGLKSEVISVNNTIHSRLAKQNVARVHTFEFLSRVKTFLQWTIDACLVLLCAFWLFPTGQITVVVLLIILNYKSLMYDTVGFFSKIKSYYVQGDYQAGRILEVINTKDAEQFGSEAISLLPAGITVKNLSFGYGDQLVLNNISFKIAPNSCSVFVGSSGSGKSTLFGLLSKLLDTKDGKIFFNGLDINSFDEQSFRSALCIINQEPFIFNATVEENIRIVKPSASRDEVVKACNSANIHDEILGFSEGYNTQLCENGANLSGGQKQRIAIARTILKDTPVILFDEPTSALDKENQTLFFQVLAKLKKSKTILVIAHKLNSYEVFDNIFTLKDGKIK
ncbi:MAG: ABC transporter ATP-binding protein/permease [Christensenellaceae bacterium]|jgi:ABC-type multidrug transport system fused ATPase/permease subunit|nr:ABC transporter ATP-binding protein/permease [Christensenellaceae bacterium]